MTIQDTIVTGLLNQFKIAWQNRAEKGISTTCDSLEKYLLTNFRGTDVSISIDSEIQAIKRSVSTASVTNKPKPSNTFRAGDFQQVPGGSKKNTGKKPAQAAVKKPSPMELKQKQIADDIAKNRNDAIPATPHEDLVLELIELVDAKEKDILAYKKDYKGFCAWVKVNMQIDLPDNYKSGIKKFKEEAKKVIGE